MGLELKVSLSGSLSPSQNLHGSWSLSPHHRPKRDPELRWCRRARHKCLCRNLFVFYVFVLKYFTISFFFRRCERFWGFYESWNMSWSDAVDLTAMCSVPWETLKKKFWKEENREHNEYGRVCEPDYDSKTKYLLILPTLPYCMYKSCRKESNLTVLSPPEETKALKTY